MTLIVLQEAEEEFSESVAYYEFSEAPPQTTSGIEPGRRGYPENSRVSRCKRTKASFSCEVVSLQGMGDLMSIEN